MRYIDGCRLINDIEASGFWKTVDEAVRRCAVIPVDVVHPRSSQLESRGVAEQEELDYRHEQELRNHETVAEDLEELLAEQLSKCLHRYSIRGLKLRITAERKTNAMLESVSVSLHIIV